MVANLPGIAFLLGCSFSRAIDMEGGRHVRLDFQTAEAAFSDVEGNWFIANPSAPR
jgi:hypothetical protein